ncbi:B12-binding domain-containing radical SAM protein, partial [bacterium]|nr:B12-binding domain-containing radical SAM protein [bacterium]
MKIVLINPFPENAYGINEATIEPPLGLGYIATVLENDNCDVQIIDANVLGIHAPGVVDLTDKIKPDLIGVSTNIVTCVSSFNLITLLCRRLKKTQIIIGGPYPTSLPEYNLRTSDADAVVIGEGEQTVKEIVENMQKGKHPYEDVDGVAFKEDDHIIMNKTRRFIEDIDELGFPAYHLLPDMRRYKSRARQTPVASIITSRGCPYQCVYCNKGIFGNRVRMRSAENVMEEINYLVKEYKVRQIDILDDNFTADVKRAER